MEKTLAVLWTLALGVNILSCTLGSEPTWLLVFVPLTCLVKEKWEIYFNKIKH